jgi:hypothetical protein
MEQEPKGDGDQPSFFVEFRFGPSSLTAFVTWVTTSTNLVDSAEEIQENCRRPGSIPMCSMRFLNKANLRRA